MSVVKNFFMVFSTWLLHSSGALDRLQAEQEVLSKILSEKTYNPNIRPLGKDGMGAVVARTNMYVRRISGMDDVNMEYNIQLTFRQEWRDSRLAFNSTGTNLRYLTVVHPEKVWSPDVFFSNEQNGHFHNIIKPNTLMRIFPDGDVLYSTRVSLTLSCPMDLHNYPMDRQTCSVVLASYAYTTEDIIFLWKEKDPIQMSKSLKLSRFQISGYQTDYCTSRTSTGEYTCLSFMLNFTRELSYYMLQVYIPFTFFVLLSWIPFWLDYRATTARVAIWIAILLAMIISISSIQAKLPAVSYTKAIDVWTGICLSFLFGVIIELALVTQFAIQEEKVRNQANAALAAEDAMMENNLMNIDDRPENKAHQDSKLGRVGKWLNKYPSKVQRIDVVSRICFPVAFLIFNVFYWSSYAGRN